MAEADVKEDAQPESKSGGGVMGMIVLALGCAGSAFAMVYLLTPTETAAPAQQACMAEEAQTPVIESALKEDAIYKELPEILITVGEAPATRYLKMNVSIITEKDGADQVESAEPVLIDAFNTYLRSLKLSDFEDPGFYPLMREQLSKRAELVLGSAGSDGVLITEFLLR